MKQTQHRDDFHRLQLFRVVYDTPRIHSLLQALCEKNGRGEKFQSAHNGSAVIGRGMIIVSKRIVSVRISAGCTAHVADEI
jgi:hypothetical protein